STSNGPSKLCKEDMERASKVDLLASIPSCNGCSVNGDVYPPTNTPSNIVLSSQVNGLTAVLTIVATLRDGFVVASIFPVILIFPLISNLSNNNLPLVPVILGISQFIAIMVSISVQLVKSNAEIKFVLPAELK